MNDQRFLFVDIAKTWAIFFVVVGHVCAKCFVDLPHDDLSRVLFTFCYSFHMPLFMLLSGFCCFNPKKNYSLKDVGYRALSYLFPFVFCGIIVSCWRRDDSLMIYWYFRTLIILVLLLYISIKVSNFIVKKSFPNYLITLFLFIGLALAIYFLCKRNVIVDLFVDTTHHLYMFPYFILGWTIRRYLFMIDFILNEKIFALSSVIFFLNFTAMIHLPRFIVACAGILVFLNISQMMQNSRYANVFSNIGKKTKGIYLLHLFFYFKWPAIGLFFERMASFGPNAAICSQIIVVFPISIVITWLSFKTAAFIEKNSLLSCIVFGNIKSQRTNKCL